MQRSARLRRTVLPLWLLPFAIGCGGSSSETPPPLPPHPLHEAYRSPRVVAPKRVAPRPDAEEVDAEGDSEPGAEPSRPGGASRTWGSGEPPPLPETELK